MPLEIRELIIKVTVNENSKKNNDRLKEEKLNELKAKIVKECTDKILSRIQRYNER